MMEQKIKLILIGVIGFLILILGITAVTSNSRIQKLVSEREELLKTNASLKDKMDNISSKVRDYKYRADSLAQQFDAINKEKDEIQKKYDLVNKAREELVQKLKSQGTTDSESAPIKKYEKIDITSTANNDAYWAQILKAKTDLEMQLNSLRKELKGIQIDNEQLQRDRGTLELDINNLKYENEDLKRQLVYNKKLMDSISQELVRERNDKMQIQDNFKSLKGENNVLLQQLKGLNNRKIALEKKLDELQQEKGVIEKRLNEMETMITGKISQINELREQLGSIRRYPKNSELMPKSKNLVELPAIVVKPQDDASAVQAANQKSLNAKIIAVNRDDNFAIIDLGQDAGVKNGDRFSVIRGKEQIASLEAVQVRRDISACDIQKESKKINIGDSVKQ